jgi:phospholipase C
VAPRRSPGVRVGDPARSPGGHATVGSARYNRTVTDSENPTTASALTRRDVLRLGAMGGVLALSHLPPSLRSAIAKSAPPGGLGQVRHVVLYMQENRSFDHYFGTLRGVRGFGDTTAVRTRSTPSMFEQPHPAGGMVMPFSTRDAAQRQQQELQYIESTPHGWDDGVGAWARGWNDGWIANKGLMTMTALDRLDLPFQYELADAFTICDAYHCSVPSSTSPNRNHFVSGYTGFEPDSRLRAVTNAGYEDSHPGYEWPTYAEVLEDAGVSWKVYHEWDDYEDNNLDLFRTFKEIATEVLKDVDGGPHPSIDTFYMSLFELDEAEQDRRLLQVDAAVEALPASERSLFDRGQRRSRPGTLAQSIAADIDAGTFPTVSWVVTTAADSEHPDVSSPIQGARITHDVLEVLAANRDVWDHTVFFYTFDENDGLFDHVPPPVPPAGQADEYDGDRPVGFGARVPMIVVSPWSVGGWMNSETFDHTAMIQFVERVTGVETDQISQWRRRASGDLTSTLDFTRSGPPPALAEPGEVPVFVERWAPEPPVVQHGLAQEVGTRPACPLPYQPDAFADVGYFVDVTIANAGTRPAHFAVYSWHETTADPVHLDVEGGTTDGIEVPFAGIFYDVTVIGPNRFLRDFAGSRRGTAAGLQVRSAIAAEQPSSAAMRSRELTISLLNGGEEPVEVTLLHLAYADTPPENLTIEPGDGHELTIVTDDADGWYDVELTVADDTSYRRRLTGHIEDGLPSITG